MSALDLMLSDEIKEGLGTEILGGEIISYAQTSSTNDVALDLAAKGMREGTLVVAENQTDGRGRRKRKWLSPTGTSVLASIILRPTIMARETHIITLISAAAVAQAIRSVTKLPAAIKWPNDVIIGGKKVSGVLTEMRTERERVKFLVVGIGVTANIPRSRLPAEIRNNATSLSAELGRNVSRIGLLQEILRQLEQRYVRLKNHRIDDLMDDWKSMSATIGCQVQVNLSRRIVRGYAVDIDKTGALLVRVDTEHILRITADDVVRLILE